MSTANDLADKQCKSCEGGVPPLTGAEENILFQQIQGWQLPSKLISNTSAFKNHYQPMAYVNAVAWVSHREDHHPDMVVGYNQCIVSYTTHAVGGLSENDFICAAKIDKLFTI